MINNYIKNRQREIRFIDEREGPPKDAKPDQWWLWTMPAHDLRWQAFRLIGESTDTRCERLGHSPRECKACRMPASRVH